jgi:translocation and assembly module TamA
MLFGAPRLHAADPQDYQVDLATTGDGAIDSTLKATSELESLRGSAPVSPFGLIARARGDVDRLKTVFESFGYYESAVAIKIEGLPLNDPNLGETLNGLPKGRRARVAIGFQRGPLYHLRRIDIDGALPESVRGVLGLVAGAPAVAADVLGAGNRLLAALQQQGYAFAKVDPPVAYEAQDAPALDVVFHVSTGARVAVGDIRIVGLKRVPEKRVRARLLLRSGGQYDPAAIERARRDLLNLGVFASVSVHVGTAVDATGGVPITFDVTERLRHAVSVNSAYSSDLGGSGGVTWTDRNVFGSAEQLTVAASVINLGGSATTGVGYDTSAKILIPDFGHRDQSLQFTVGAVKEYLLAYDQTAVTSAATLTRKLSSIWTASVGVATANERVIQEGTTRSYTLISAPLTASLDTTHLASPLDDPLHGVRASVSVDPTRSFGHPNATFIISEAKVAGYFDLHEIGLTEPGRSVLAARALTGVVQGAGVFSLPPDQRFYGGGSATMRGYRFQAVGPYFTADGNPIGGTTIEAGSFEIRQRFGTNYGVALFVDGGRVGANLTPSKVIGPQGQTEYFIGKNQVNLQGVNEFFIGVGAGIRYYTPIGPIRLDIAVPTKRYSQDDDRFEIYIGLGQAF